MWLDSDSQPLILLLSLITQQCTYKWQYNSAQLANIQEKNRKNISTDACVCQISAVDFEVNFLYISINNFQPIGDLFKLVKLTSSLTKINY